MGKFAKNNMIHIGLATTIVGAALTFLSWMVAFVASSTYLDWYREITNVGVTGNDWNLVVVIAGPLILITGIWYFVEQILKRRRFEKLIETSKKSEFVARRKDLSEIARILPDSYQARIKEKEEELRAKRA